VAPGLRKSRCARPWRHPTAPAVTAPACPIRIVAVQLLSAAGRTCRQLFLTADGELSLHPHWLPR